MFLGELVGRIDKGHPVRKIELTENELFTILDETGVLSYIFNYNIRQVTHLVFFIISQNVLKLRNFCWIPVSETFKANPKL